GLQVLEIPRRVVGVECPVPDNARDRVGGPVVMDRVTGLERGKRPTGEIVVGQKDGRTERVGSPEMGDGPRPRIDINRIAGRLLYDHEGLSPDLDHAGTPCMPLGGDGDQYSE